MAAPLLTLQNIALTFGGTPLMTEGALSIGEAARICIVGRNGTGKSTLMKVAAGLIEPDKGTRFVKPGTTLRYLPQEPAFSGFETALAYVESGLGPGDDRHRALRFLQELGLTGDENPAVLSGGEARRVALARVLAPEPDILLLDEPTNHLDIGMIEWLEDTLASLSSAVVLISHDRRFLTKLSRSTVWLDRGKTRELDFGFAQFESWRDSTLEQEEIERHKLARKIEREADWLRYGVTARRKRNVRRLAALNTMREERRTAKKRPGDVKLASSEAGLSGKLVIEAKSISKSFGDSPVVRDFSIRVHRGDRLGVVGPNGAGKTTLLNMLIGKLEPDAGSVRLGSNLEIASLEQGRDSLKPDWTLAEALTSGGGDTVTINGQARHVSAYMQDFLFQPEQIRTPIKVLSGGERARLMLARALAKPSNLVVLDEPTNDLDLETLDVLEEMLADYAGTIILISHDRDFLDRCVTSVVAPEDGGVWHEYAGGYTDMLSQRKSGFGGVRRAAKTEPKESAARTAPVAPGGEQKKRRLSFNQKHALETLPSRIAELEKTIGQLQERLSDPNLFAADRSAFDRASQALTKAQAELEEAENRWLELEILREQLAS